MWSPSELSRLRSCEETVTVQQAALGTPGRTLPSGAWLLSGWKAPMHTVLPRGRGAEGSAPSFLMSISILGKIFSFFK